MRPCVVLYLYVHGRDEQFDYPTSRSRGVAAVAARYMECALVQAASLRLRAVECDLVLVTNLADAGVGGRALRLLEALRALDVEVLAADYAHRPAAPVSHFMSSQYVFDAITAVAQRSAPERQLWLMDVDCVWFDPRRVFAAAPAPPAIGAIKIPYPQDWNISGITVGEIGALAQRLGAADAAIPWVGGELIVGTSADLCALVAACKTLEREALQLGCSVHTEEHLLSLVAVLGRPPLHDLASVGRRILTGPRHEAPPVENPTSIGVWHLPAEKGLSFRRGADEVLAGHGARLARDLDDPAEALRRFNIAGGGWQRRLRDDTWIASQRLRDGVSGLLSRA